MSFAIRLGGFAAAAALAIGGATLAPAANADDESTATTPCASQQAKVDKAEGALARVTAIFDRQAARVKKERKVAEAAAPGQERAAARKALAEAKAKKADAKENKRAQQQRLAKAQARLDACLAAPTETPTQTPTQTPTSTPTETPTAG